MNLTEDRVINILKKLNINTDKLEIFNYQKLTWTKLTTEMYGNANIVLASMEPTLRNICDTKGRLNVSEFKYVYTDEREKFMNSINVDDKKAQAMFEGFYCHNRLIFIENKERKPLALIMIEPEKVYYCFL